jgi:hypothetical protein
MPAQYLKPYVKTNKSDYVNAEAIAEAVGRPKMRFVPIKSDDRLDLQSLHRVRERWPLVPEWQFWNAPKLISKWQPSRAGCRSLRLLSGFERRAWREWS